MRVHSIFLHLMRSLSEYPLWSTLRVRPSHRVFYSWGVRPKAGILHMYAMRAWVCVARVRPPEGHQAGPTECRWHSAMCDCVHSMGLAAYAQTGPAGAARCSKPTKCWKLPSLHSCVCMHPSIRPCGSWFPPVGGWVQKRTKEGSNPQGMSLPKRLEAETATRRLSPELRSWLAPLYTDLHSPPGCMISVHARLWPSFLSALDAKAVLRSAAHGIFMPPGSKILEYQGACIRTPSDLPCAAPSHKSAWVRVADASAEHTRLSKLSKQSVEWLLQCFHLDLACPLRSKPMLACKAAADACAEGNIVGIGGWFISTNSVSWFAETWQFQKVQEQWPCLTKEAQRYIACFKTLAQLALVRIAWSCEGQSVRGLYAHRDR